VVLWGDDHLSLGDRRVVALSDRCAIGLSAGDQPKVYAHMDPNEDGIAAVERTDTNLLICADGHNGVTSIHAAIDTLLEQLGSLPSPNELSDDRLVDVWLEANQRVIEAGRSAGQPESRTTLILVLAGDGVMRWAAMGDSLLAVVDSGGAVRRLNRARSHFVGWPMTRLEVAGRLQRGTEGLADGTVITATDGLTDFVPDLDRALAHAASYDRASSTADLLLQAAFARGAGDNVAVGVVRVRRRS
jgi:serine/threonine protein phosphatase PrpC